MTRWSYRRLHCAVACQSNEARKKIKLIATKLAMEYEQWKLRVIAGTGGTSLKDCETARVDT